jgi:hypothetical protein
MPLTCQATVAAASVTCAALLALPSAAASTLAAPYPATSTPPAPIGTTTAAAPCPATLLSMLPELLSTRFLQLLQHGAAPLGEPALAAPLVAPSVSRASGGLSRQQLLDALGSPITSQLERYTHYG